MDDATIFLIVLAILFWGGVFLFGWLFPSKQEPVPEKRIEETPKEVEIKRDPILDFMVEKIKKYPNNKKFHYESHYHDALYGYLQAYFPDIIHEQTNNDSRPDLTLGDEYIAIEVKGPTTAKELDNVYYIKCKKYSKIYEHTIIVLFHPEVSHKKWMWFYNEMRVDYPDVEVIVKS